MEEEKTKLCSKCRKEKLLGEFSKNRSTPDDLERWCKDCKGKQHQDYRDRHKDGGNGKKIARKKYWRKTESTKKIKQSIKEPLTTASPEAIIAALRKGVAREIIQIIEERF